MSIQVVRPKPSSLSSTDEVLAERDVCHLGCWRTKGRLILEAQEMRMSFVFRHGQRSTEPCRSRNLMMCSLQSPSSFRSRRRLVPVLASLGFAFFYACASLYMWHEGFVRDERESPLDHWATAVKKPFYGLLCPSIPNQATNLSADVPTFMISARPYNQVDYVLHSWTDAGLPVQLVNTTEWSLSYVNTKCRRQTFGSRLFAVYQRLLQEVLLFNRTMESSHVVVLEDDTLLKDADGLRREINWAISHNVDYYSLYATPNSESCIYSYGTNAQVMSRRFAARLVQDVDPISFCRLPIDIWISTHGPFYVTERQLVEHVGKRFHVP
jgi:hypothetical protein